MIEILDVACRDHDIAYSNSIDLAEQHAADNILTEKARKRITVRDPTLEERAAARTVRAKRRLIWVRKQKKRRKVLNETSNSET